MLQHLYKFLADKLRSRRALAVGLVLAALSLAAACGGGDGKPQAETPAPDKQLNAVVASSDLAVGPNRFSLGLITQDNELVTNAQLHFRFFKLDGEESILKSETDAKLIKVTNSFTRTREDGTVETVEAGETAVYVANVEFDETGNWGVEASGARDGEPFEPVTAAFTVLENSQTLAVGELAPLSLQTIVSDVADITDIDTSDPPIPEMHDMTIADAVTSGKPTVIVIATPAFCLSRICGPTKQVVDQVYADYKGQANFVHVEPYDLEKARSGEGLEVIPFLEQDWGLLTEPWVFLVDRDGTIAAKFEAVVSQKELEDALRQVL
ncbi:MAG: hypothetical protein V3S01_13160 [Dehalococcoidia bacterium]